MEENRLSSLEGLPQAKRRDSSDAAHNDDPATSLLTNATPRIPSSYVSSLLPGDSELFHWTLNYPDMVVSEVDDCVSEVLPHAKKRTAPPVSYHNQKSGKTSLENQVFESSSLHRQILADRVQNSIENLRVFNEKLCNMVGLEGHGHGNSEGLPQAKKRREISQLPNDQDAKLGDSVPNLQVCNRDHQFGLGKLDVVSSENLTSVIEGVVRGTSSGEGSSQWMSQITQESLTATLTPESPVSEGGESKCSEGKRSASTDDLKDLLSSLQFLLSVLKRNDEAQKISRAKTQALREKKEALRLERQQYKDKYKQQHVAEYSSSVSQEKVRD
ncbi:hypothetical protein M758_11G080900 [Ceratodon purpureus]|nr:hypothetical protein M758_11G080900 [Ceratodon purpureus]